MATVFEKTLRPVVIYCANKGLNPNVFTLAGGLVTLAGASVLGLGVIRGAGVIYLIGASFDMIDGELARYRGVETYRGALLDSTLDRFGEGVMHVAGAYYFARKGMSLGVLAAGMSLVGAYLTSYVRARSEGLGVDLTAGWFGRPERVMLLSICLLAAVPRLGFWLLALFAFLAAAQRGWLAWWRLRERDYG